MSDSNPSKVFFFDNDDPEMQQAYETARANFRYFWRELSWEGRRIVPALDLACVKAPFADENPPRRTEEHPGVEQMWISDVDFDGEFVRGTLLNSPNWLKTVNAGDPVKLLVNRITDWMYAIDGQVYGAFTVNLMRSRMDARERKEHDAAWGLKFGDPASPQVVPKWKKGGIEGWFGKKPSVDDEHPMSENMGPALKEQLEKDPSMVTSADERGWTLLHHQALAGSSATVNVLLEAGADRNAKTKRGHTPLQLARTLGWDKVVAILTST